MSPTADNAMEKDPDGGSRPVPDPTILTTDAVNQAIRVARDYTDGKIAVLVERLRGIDTATEVLNETVTRVPTETQKEVGHLKELTDEKFSSVDSILDEQRRGMLVAEQEREKAAKALRIELNRAIEEGDRALRDHIAAQVAQIKASLESAEALAQQRMQSVSDQVSGERRVSELTQRASDTAISKAESAASKQFDEFSKAVTLQLDAMRTTMQDITQRMDKTLS